MEPHIPELERLKRISENLVSPELSVHIVDALPDALVVAEMDTGRIVLFNSRAELVFGYSRSEVFGQPVEILLPDESRPKHVGHRRAFSDDPRARPMGTGMILSGRHKTGAEFPAEINLSPIVTTDGTFVCAVVRRVKRPADAGS